MDKQHDWDMIFESPDEKEMELMAEAMLIQERE